jgi:hypothetical protein
MARLGRFTRILSSASGSDSRHAAIWQTREVPKWGAVVKSANVKVD